MKRIWLVVAAVVLAGVTGLFGCAAVNLPAVSAEPAAIEAHPPVLGAFAGDPPISDAEAWRARRAPLLQEAFQAHIYGRMPAPVTPIVAQRTTLDAAAIPGAGRVEQLTLALGESAAAAQFNLLLVLPAAANEGAPAPVVVMQNFCGNAVVFPEVEGVAGPLPGGPSECGSGWARPLIEGVFGSASITPPVQAILTRGYGLAMFYAGDVAPDSATRAPPALAALTPPSTPADQRTGAIMAWAWLYSRALDVLALEPGVDPARIVAWGHSRNGKSALVAAAFDPRIAGVIALQPGTGGGSLGRDAVGESIAQITGSYPHWFAPAYAAYAGREMDLPVDQHQLIALIAPRPVLMGAARRDQWSDPHGAYRAMEAASPVYRLFGADAFAPETLRKSLQTSPLVYYMRGGLHGVHQRDWREALDFLDAQVRAPARP